ncbi:DNA polymerase III subunit chi [Erythrobacter rubeus]|uniref:DNA polymerase III subunit chi n=1 Tax=Erythrobacter rubeus TaxID=2760803 RepID=A0ABR8KPR8_9SPHN|nr:DNA polymerase III subunit chi [Erythrobacter rubeus]MBD2841280.1 DNA polymerase III subunit chi [Erythrobacter rubeus]
MKVDFWQLSYDPAEKVCALIAERVLDSGERLLVVSADAEQREAISKSLWKSSPTSFLANGEAGSAGADRQPVLLSDTPDAANNASHVIFADGQFRETAGFDRTFLLFNEDTLEQARATWRSLDGKDELERSYFRQENGKWVKVA